jgi:pimeloyl-ACP methyl ester carboxylesterase
MSKYSKYLLFVSLGMLFVFCTIVYIFSNMILFPRWYKPGLTTDCGKTVITHHPELCQVDMEKGLTDKWEPIQVKSSVGNVTGWYFPNQKNLDKVVIFLHGAGADRREGYSRRKFLESNGFSYIVYDAPNHGKSDTNGKGVQYGFREQEGFKSIFDFARQRHKSIFVITNSFGISAVALSLDYWRGGIQGIIVENPPYSLERIVKENPIAASLPIWLVNFVLKFTEWRANLPIQTLVPGELAKKFPNIPIYVFHGMDDTTVPFSHGEEFFQNLNTPYKKFFKAEKTDHGQVYYQFPKDYEKLVLENFAIGIQIQSGR